ncbi:MAG TPA: hypothetical protein DCE42_13945 [Myxococcales bacterium]|nr:hypothetical protein [Deltaproteobacteria bacterium]MBU50961.1 hypothetical protein [Deltaproteobacteria bacterium]HAA55860.1 hypothetical protein [Myxococcales bacterium]|tara:strand:- start:14131 stop:15129 length:999 start_codon:yes stop_codon:yes gene_type:complete
MAMFLLSWLLLYVLLAGFRGYRVLQREGQRSTQTIRNVLLSSVLFSGAIVLSLAMPLFIESPVTWMSHTHTSQNDMLHRLTELLQVSRVQWLILLFLLFILSVAWGPLLYRWYQMRAWFRFVRHASFEGKVDQDLLIDEANVFRGTIVLIPGAWSGLVGVFRPTLFLGKELLVSLSPHELYALLAHEEAHRRQRDTLTQSLLMYLCRLLPFIGESLFALWSQRAETDSDCFAAQTVQDPLIVASALLKVSRLQQQDRRVMSSFAGMAPSVVSFTQYSCLETRIQALIAMDTHAPKQEEKERSAYLLYTAFIVLLLQSPLHHIIEYFISLLHM